MISGKKIESVLKQKNDEEQISETLDVEQFSKDQIIKFIESKFSGHGLAILVEQILLAKGFVTKSSPPGPDGGVDILAGSGPLGFDNPKICVQVKSQRSPIEAPKLRELDGAAKKFGADYGIFVSWGGFTKSALDEARNSFFQTRLWDQGALLEEIVQNYEKFSDDVKAEFPLKRIWTLTPEEEIS